MALRHMESHGGYFWLLALFLSSGKHRYLVFHSKEDRNCLGLCLFRVIFTIFCYFGFVLGN